MQAVHGWLSTYERLVNSQNFFSPYLTQEDLSRLGRNYIEVGNYTEMLFPRWNVRYIAVNDNYDSLYSEGNEFAPFKNLFNEWFARDTSKKIRAVVKAKAERGERVSTQIPYGYKKDTDVKGHLLIDEETAPVVRMIFDLCAAGNGPRIIANILREKKILKPTVYRYRQIGSYGCITDTDDIYGWNDRTVAGILDNEVYLGHTVNCKTTVASYKDKRKLERPESEWLRFENTHEAIIDQVTWDIVRKVRAGKRRRTSMGDLNKYNGLLCCSDCGSKLYFVRGTTIKPENYSFICSRYRKHMGEEQCTPHSIKEVVLDEIILEEIRKATYYERAKTKEFVEFINKKSSSENRRELTAKTNELGKLEKRNTELNALFKRLYEDNLEGKITDERFAKMTANYEAEQHTLELSVAELRTAISAEKETALNADHFLSLVRKYTEIPELTAEIIREFVEKVYVYKAEKIDGHRVQRIKIIYNCIGEFTLPDVAEDEKTA